MQLLTNYSPCFSEGGGQKFLPYADSSSLKIVCTTCQNEARTVSNGSEKRFYCDCYNDETICFSCSFALYDEMLVSAQLY